MSLSRKYALKLALIYVAIGSLWIFSSDWIVLHAALDPAKVTDYQNIKGIFYIVITTLLVYILAKKSFRSIETASLQKQLELTKAASQKIFTHLGEVVLQLNPETHQVVKCNSAVKSIFGYEPAAVIGQKCEMFHLSHDNHQVFEARYNLDLEKIGVSRSYYQLQHADGSVLETEITLFSIHEISPQEGSLVVIIRDLTERKAMQAQLQQNQKMESIGIMASGIAHEINNPIMVIDCYADMIRSEAETNDKILTLTEGIQDQTERIDLIVKNLLGYARKDSTPNMELFQISDVVNKSLQLIGTNLRLDSIKIEEDYPEQCAAVQGYPHQLQQVVLNLINNARDALNDRYPQRDPGKTIRFSIREQASPQAKVILMVEDQGMGMASDRCQRIFDPFYTTKAHGKGTGLGLWIVYEIIKKHEGCIRVESEPEKFTRFTIELPCANPR